MTNIILLPTPKAISHLVDVGFPGFREFFSGNRCYLAPKASIIEEKTEEKG